MLPNYHYLLASRVIEFHSRWYNNRPILAKMAVRYETFERNNAAVRV